MDRGRSSLNSWVGALYLVLDAVIFSKYKILGRLAVVEQKITHGLFRGSVKSYAQGDIFAFEYQGALARMGLYFNALCENGKPRRVQKNVGLVWRHLQDELSHSQSQHFGEKMDFEIFTD